MAQSHTLASLRQLSQEGGGRRFDVLTVYIGADDTGHMSPKHLMSQFHSLRHSSLSAEQKEKFREDLERIELFLATYQPNGNRSVAFFSAANNLWEVLEFEFPLQPFMGAAREPYLAPIDLALKTHDSYVVLLVNKKRARLISVKMGEITASKELTNPEHMPDVKLLRTEGLLGGQDKAFRHTQKYLLQYLKSVAHEAAEFMGRTNARYLIIGGHKEMLGKFKALLPARLRNAIRGELVALPDMPTPVVIKKTQEVITTITTTETVVPLNAMAA